MSDEVAPEEQPDPFAELRSWAEAYEDEVQFKISSENKIRSKTVKGVFDEIAKYHAASQKIISREMTKYLRTILKDLPSIRAWSKSEDAKGVGDPLLARLLGTIGDPYRATPSHWEGKGKDNRYLVADPPYDRSLSQLWSLCGLGDPQRTMHKDISAEEIMALGKPRAKMILWLLATSCVINGVTRLDHCDDTNGYDLDGRKSTSHYGQVYLDARAHYAGTEHPWACARCTGKGKPPAPIGSERSPGHQQAMALRKVSKEILRDLWTAAREDAQ